MKKAFCSWSGGKDSCLALYRAKQQGYDVQFLLTAFDETGERSRSHASSRLLLEQQALALGIPLIVIQTSWQDYETRFVEQLKQFEALGITHGIFGDIDLQAHRDWEEKVCAQANIEAVLPLWNENRLKMVHEFLDNGFKSMVVCINENFLDPAFCGREFNSEFIRDLPENVDACGENGEFHTFAFDGPLFSQSVKFTVGERYHVAPTFPQEELLGYTYVELTT